MIKSEYVRNLNKNFERILLNEKTDCKRYQYCILFRGGIKYLLPCSCRQINESSYLYYDISSNQNIKQLFSEKNINRKWMKAFFWSIRRLRQELNRFLLDEQNIIWSPEHIYQDLERNDFMFLYVPYYGQEQHIGNAFENLLEFWVDRVDYEDTALVEYVYHVYEQFMNVGYCYVERQMFEDFNKLPEQKGENEAEEKKEVLQMSVVQEAAEKKGIKSFFGRSRRKQDDKDIYREALRQSVAGYAVCEETEYGEKAAEKNVMAEEFGKTIYVAEKEDLVHGLYTEKGELAFLLNSFPFQVGKRKEDVDYALTDYSASRVHARFTEETDGIYLEDLNSTNGTFKNGLRMQPYEKRKLDPEDTLRFGKSTFIYK